MNPKLLTFFILTTLITSSCAPITHQNNYVYGLHVPERSETITLSEDVVFDEMRGKLKTRYYALAGKGNYELVMESDSGSYFYAYDPEFTCEGYDIGGLFETKEREPKVYLWTTAATDEEKFLEKIKDDNTVANYSMLSHPKRPYIHWGYEVGKSKYE